LEFASALAEKGNEIQLTLTVAAVDEKTESVVVEIEGSDINFEHLTERIKELGAAVHSIDEVQVIRVQPFLHLTRRPFLGIE